MSNTHPKIDGSTGKRRKQYVDHSKSKSRICIIHGTGNYSNECKVLGGVCTNYSAAHPTKDLRINPVPRKIFQKNQENRDIINNVVDEIILN